MFVIVHKEGPQTFSWKKVSNSAFEDESIGVTVERSIDEEKCLNDFWWCLK